MPIQLHNQSNLRGIPENVIMHAIFMLVLYKHKIELCPEDSFKRYTLVCKSSGMKIYNVYRQYNKNNLFLSKFRKRC